MIGEAGDEEDTFFGFSEAEVALLPLGLIAPPRARILHAKDGTLLWDEVAEDELAFRMAGGIRIVFIGDDGEVE